jgi:hypothetical protein
LDLKNQMLHPYLLEWKKGTKWYVKLFQRLLNVAIHNSMVIYRSHPIKEKMDTLHFRLSLAQDLVEERGYGVLRPAHDRPSVQPPPKWLTEKTFPGAYPPPPPPTGKKAKPQVKFEDEAMILKLLLMVASNDYVKGLVLMTCTDWGQVCSPCELQIIKSSK